MDENPEDFDDDLDIDLDDDDLDIDLDDDSWDDFDDTETSEESASEMPAEMQRGGEKSFVSKHFNLIVVAVALLGGGGWLYMQMFAPPSGQTSVQENVENPELANSAAPPSAPQDDFDDLDIAAELSDPTKLPPMPAPINAVEAEASAPEVAPIDQDLADEILTPMPNFASAEKQYAPEAQAPILEIDHVLSGMPENIASQLPTAISPEVAPILEEETPAAVIDMPTPIAAPAPAPVILDIAPLVSVAPSVMPPAIAKDITGIENRLAQIEEANNTLSQQILSTTTAITALNATVEAMQSAIEDLPRAEAPAAKPKSVAAAKPAKVISKPPTPPKSPAKTVKKKTAEPVSWNLRSAQPGKAILSAKGKGDIRSVKTGDTLNGLGKIVSIQVENGLWVVTGTKGRVSQ